MDGTDWDIRRMEKLRKSNRQRVPLLTIEEAEELIERIRPVRGEVSFGTWCDEICNQQLRHALMRRRPLYDRLRKLLEKALGQGEKSLVRDE